MMLMEPEPDTYTDLWPLLWPGLAVSVAALVVGALVARAGRSEGGSSGRCLSPSCLRCHGEEELRKGALRRCGQYVSRELASRTRAAEEEGAWQLKDVYPRVYAVIQSAEQKEAILKLTYRRSNAELPTSQPHIWTMPGLSWKPIWIAGSTEDEEVGMMSSPKVMSSLKEVTSSLEADHVLDDVLSEYEGVAVGGAWQVNSTPRGCWRLLPLYSQGAKVGHNCTTCPHTAAVLERLPSFMRGNAFGNAALSVVEPGSLIEPHTGPCNFRLRCHLPLVAPRGFGMRVGGRKISWERGRVVVFDDSFVHSVWGSEAGRGEGVRVVLIVDVWHPEVTLEERRALDAAFPADTAAAVAPH